ncbi:triphosphoribosyl-dephospho-CoA synthase [Lacrimispora sp.]|uniref:triphosphoribosyl-dephospho-CoA synthase n=1 Tax=Lacrimispora sp. TaxID=2719234 RepID=UPI00289E7E7C|nr:triphosphoribosyl-dephospho-CoA synthase [Lacrimispora sp.]
MKRLKAEYADWIGERAKQSLLEEVYTTPKPGLVDLLTNGAHKDMDFHSFEQSASVLEPYFKKMAALGVEGTQEPEDLFLQIRRVGIVAECAMLRVTGGVNTHKGAIFTIGILCASAGRCYARFGKVTIQDLIQMEQRMVRTTLLRELTVLRNQIPESNGCRNLIGYNSWGIRGEAIGGYRSVTEIALPILICGRKKESDWNLIKLQALLALMSVVDDGNVLARRGKEGLETVKLLAGKFLEEGGAYGHGAIKKLQDMDELFTRENYSSGGCADLLAAGIFLIDLLGI